MDACMTVESEDAVRAALSMWRGGVRIMMVHLATVADAESTARALAKYPDVRVRLSPPTETHEEFTQAIRASGQCIHVYCEEVCEWCDGLSSDNRYYEVKGLFDRICTQCIGQFMPSNHDEWDAQDLGMAIGSVLREVCS